MLYCFELFGVVVAALSGVLAAGGKRIDLFGVVVLALVTALGGGTVRDLALGVSPVFWINAPHFVVAAAITAVVMFAIAHRWTMPAKLFAIADALVLAFFTLTGAAKALQLGAGPVNGVVLGVITGVAGGMLRDVLLGEIPLVFRKETLLYATAAFVGAVVFVVLDGWMPGGAAGRISGAAVTLVLRFAAIQWRLSLPVFKS
jgi:uncharacterized membrane protein YeiH